MKIKRKFLVLFMIIFTICSFIGIKAIAISNEGKVIVNKTSVKDDEVYGRSAKVNLEVSGIKKEINQEIEIIFVLDRSSSMDGKKISEVKSSSISIINKILPNDNINIGIVSFGDNVLNTYSSKSLLNNKDYLINLVNSIPNNSKTINKDGLGTNISEALEYANNMFSNKNNTKAIILLSDGEPTYFTYNSKLYGNGINNESYCVEHKGMKCIKSYKPSEYTKVVTDEIIKTKSIYSIGYAVNNSTKKFLTSISNKYYDAKNEKELTNNFNNIIESITIIADNLVITDIVPKYFNIDKTKILNDYPDALVYENTNGTYTIKFKLNKLDTNINYNFSYDVIVKDDYYGRIYTNDNAIIEGNSLVKDVYTNDLVKEIFPKPIINVPSITNDDSYYVKLGNTLNIDNVSGILSNDKLNQINDDNSNIVNKIIINNTNNSCGNILVDDDGSFKYIPDSSCLDKEVEFSYYIETTINNDVVKSNNSIIKIKVDKDSSVIDNPIITKKGTDIVNNKNDIVNYKINYHTLLKNYIGNAKIIITDNLPCEIDLDNSELDNAIYDKNKLTLTWIINVNDIDTYTFGNKLINIDKNINVKYKNIIKYKKITNNVSGKIILNDKDNEINTSFDTLVNIKGKVIVSYVDTEDNKLKDDVIITDLIDNDYITKEEVFDNYKLVSITGNVRGKINVEDTLVIYKYYNNSSKTMEELIKKGTKKIDNLDNRIDYNIFYTTKIDNYIGKSKMEIIDILPYEIDLENSNIGKFTYNKDNNTLYYSIELDIDTYKDGSYNYEFNEEITIKYKNILNNTRTIENKVKSILTTNEVQELEDSFITNIEIKSNVIGIYVDTTGKKISKDIIINNLVGNSYVLDKLDIKGYTLKEIKGEVSGIHEKEDKEVIFIYDVVKELPPKTGLSKINYIFISIVAVISVITIILRKKEFKVK